MIRNTLFLPNNFFDLTNVSFVDIFEEVDFVWEPIKEIEDYILSVFKLGKLKPNHGENCFIGEGTVIEEGVMIKGPAIIGKNCVIAHGAYIRENCILGDNVKIGHASEAKNSIILNSSTIAHFNYVGDSIIGGNVNLGGGAKTANFRLDGKSIQIKTDVEIIDTKLIKLGAIVGDNCKIGVNSVLNPGTILGKNCLVYPLTSVVGIKSEGTIIK